MSCYVSFFLGDFTKEDQDNFNWDKAPCLLSVSIRNDIGKCIDKFEYDKATIVTKEVIKQIIIDLDAMIRERKDSIRELNELKDSILKNMPIKGDDYIDAKERISELNAEMEELDEEINYIIRNQGVLDSIEDLIISNFSITALVG